jgi:hypothetical protein
MPGRRPERVEKTAFRHFSGGAVGHHSPPAFVIPGDHRGVAFADVAAAYDCKLDFFLLIHS